MEKIILIFIDGIGIGEKNSGRNPILNLFTDISPEILLCRDSFPALFPGGAALAMDACLGVAGIPQSATGQTSLFTGVNAQALLGYHLNAMPNQPLIELIHQKSLTVTLKEKGIRSINANLHSSEYFKTRRGGHKNRFPVSTMITFAGKIPFLFEKDYRKDRAVFMDITGQIIQDRGGDLPVITPHQAADRLCTLSDEAEFVFFEYFLTDRWGHKRNRDAMTRCMNDLIPFLGALSRKAPEQGIHLMICSDHGNAEDFQTGDHTRNPIPFVYCPPVGQKVPELSELPHSLTEVSEMVQRIYTKGICLS